MTGRPQGFCKNPDCTFNTGGACVDAFSEEEIATKCPNFSLGDEGADNPDKTAPVGKSKPLSTTKKSNDGEINLPSGAALYAEDLYKITSASPAKIILFSGPIDSGKTTFTKSIYEEFIKGPFANHLFSGSETLLGFEQRCHLSRGASGLDKAHTERTHASTSEVLLHLVTCHKNDIGSKIHLILVDVSGEWFDRALDSSSEVDKIPFIRQADYFVYVFDGAKLADKASRASVKSKGLGILRACCENGALNEQSHVQIIFSKKDSYHTKAIEKDTLKFIEELQKFLEELYKDKFSFLSFHHVAAEPEPTCELKPAYGIDKVFEEWLSQSAPVDLRLDYKSLEDSELSPYEGFIKTIVNEQK